MNKKQTIQELKEINNYLAIVEDMIHDLIDNIDGLELEKMYTIRYYTCTIILNKTIKINEIIQKQIVNDDIKYDMQYVTNSFKHDVNKYGYVLLSELSQERIKNIIKEIRQLKKGYDY